jgi:membrane associated rhomboid family serine protease
MLLLDSFVIHYAVCCVFVTGVSVETMTYCGAKSTRKIVNEGQWWRLLTAVFLHAGIIHAAVNLIGTQSHLLVLPL